MGNGAAKKEKAKSYLLQTCEEHESSVNCMDLSEDGSVLATGSDDKTIRLWSTKTDSVDCIGILEGHEDYITSVLIEENFVLSTSADKTIRKWDMSTCECLLSLSGHTSTVNKIICTGDFIFSISYDKTTRCWDFDTGECIRVFIGHKGNVSSIVFIPAESDDLHEAIKFVNKPSNKQNSLSVPSSKNVNLKAFSNNAENAQSPEDDDNLYSKDLIITGSLDSTAKSWSFETGECIFTYKGHTAAITCIATDQLGKLLFTGSSDHTIRSWDIMKGQALKIFEGHQTTIISIVAHKKLLYSTSSDHTARCWVMEFGDCTRVYKGHEHTVGCIYVDKGLVYTGCGDSQARCYEAKSGSLQRTFKGHGGAINCIRLIENKLFTGSFDGTLRIWDANGLLAESDQRNDKRSVSTANIAKSEIVTIENEKNYNIRLNSSPQNTRITQVKSIDQQDKQDADSGIEEFSSRSFGRRN